MIIIAESGATKTDWCAIMKGGKTVSVKTPGMNVAVMQKDAIMAIISQAAEEFKAKGATEPVKSLHYYAAGLITSEGEKVPAVAKELHEALCSLYPGAEMEYASDLLAAARSVCGHEDGIAAILGTGSNSCLFKGGKIVKNVRSAGFILGDEGGGACLGKLFMADFLKGLVPEDVSKEFAQDFEVDYMTVVANVYRGQAPSRYLGSFAPWILERYDRSDYVKNLVDNNFRNFFTRALLQYDVKSYKVGVVGGFGNANKDILMRIGEEYGVTFSKIIGSPIVGLVDYHSEGIE